MKRDLVSMLCQIKVNWKLISKVEIFNYFKIGEDEIYSNGSVRSKHKKIGPAIEQNKPVAEFKDLGWSFDDGISDGISKKNLSVDKSLKIEKPQNGNENSISKEKLKSQVDKTKSKAKSKDTKKKNISSDAKIKNKTKDLNIENVSKESSPKFDKKSKIKRRETNKPMESQIGNFKR